MLVTADETGHDHLAVEVEDFGRITYQSFSSGSVADIDDLVPPHRDRLGLWIVRVHRVDAGIGENVVGGFLGGRIESRKKDKNDQYSRRPKIPFFHARSLES